MSELAYDDMTSLNSDQNPRSASSAGAAAAATPTAGDAGANTPRQDPVSIFGLFGFLFLTFNSVASIRRSINDPWNIAFVSVSYATLLLLYYCFRLVERTSDDRRRQRLKAAVWSLASLLTAMFTFRVAAIMPPVVAALVWAASAVTVAAGFYALFLYRELPEKAAMSGKCPDAFEKC